MAKKYMTRKLMLIKQKIMDYHFQRKIVLGSGDQDTSNIAFQDYKILPFKYNTPSFAIHNCIKFEIVMIYINKMHAAYKRIPL